MHITHIRRLFKTPSSSNWAAWTIRQCTGGAINASYWLPRRIGRPVRGWLW